MKLPDLVGEIVEHVCIEEHHLHGHKWVEFVLADGRVFHVLAIDPHKLAARGRVLRVSFPDPLAVYPYTTLHFEGDGYFSGRLGLLVDGHCPNASQIPWLAE